MASAIFTGAVIMVLGEGRTWLAPVLMTPLLMVFGEISPKSIAARFPELFCRILVLPIYWFMKISFPLRWVFLHISNAVLALLGAPQRAKSNILTEEDYLTLVEAGFEEGELDANEKAYIQNIFEFHDRTVRSITVPRIDMECWDINLPMSNLIEHIRNSSHSRIPIYEGDRDHIVGILYVKDFLRLSQQVTFNPEHRLTKEMMHEPILVPEGMKLYALFRLFRQFKTHIAIVADEYGGVSGLVTMNDLLVEIFGEIPDEYTAIDSEIEQQEDGSYVCRGRLPIWEFTEQTGWDLPDRTNLNTLGGLLFTLAGHAPAVGDQVRSGEVEFTILEMKDIRVLKLRAERTGGKV